jgi:hypothetical protein
MAMAKPPAFPKPAAQSAQPRRRLLRWGLFALAVLAAAVLFVWPQVHGYAVTGEAYGARVACSCRFVGGRPPGDCRNDFEPGMELITLSEDPKARSVTARFPLIARQTATYREGWGCMLEPWND